MIDIAPKRVSTKLKLNNPINPQLTAPIMTRASAILSIIFIKPSKKNKKNSDINIMFKK